MRIMVLSKEKNLKKMNGCKSEEEGQEIEGHALRGRGRTPKADEKRGTFS